MLQIECVMEGRGVYSLFALIVEYSVGVFICVCGDYSVLCDIDGLKDGRDGPITQYFPRWSWHTHEHVYLLFLIHTQTPACTCVLVQWTSLSHDSGSWLGPTQTTRTRTGSYSGLGPRTRSKPQTDTRRSENWMKCHWSRNFIYKKTFSCFKNILMF